MNRSGHIGLVLLLVGGISIILGLSLEWMTWLLIGGVVATRIPDLDLVWRGHRGFTHSIVFLMVTSVIVGLASWVILDRISKLIPWLSFSGFAAFMIGSSPMLVGLASHLIGDVATWSGIPLFLPWRKRYSLSLCSAGSRRVNQGLLLAGSLVFVILATCRLSSFLQEMEYLAAVLT